MTTKSPRNSNGELPQGVDNGLLTKAQLAPRLQIKPRTLDAWMAAGLVPYLKIGRVVRFDWPAVQARLTASYTVHGGAK
ncbi:MAG: DNA-binding protein [Proteobacteria bacterium]|nr:DNA-binding protein [Pseudomonadota bacterium]